MLRLCGRCAGTQKKLAILCRATSNRLPRIFSWEAVAPLDTSLTLCSLPHMQFVQRIKMRPDWNNHVECHSAPRMRQNWHPNYFILQFLVLTVLVLATRNVRGFAGTVTTRRTGTRVHRSVESRAIPRSKQSPKTMRTVARVDRVWTTRAR